MAIGVLVVSFLALPGWHGELELVAHTELLATARAAGTVTPAQIDDRGTSSWDLTYLDSRPAEVLVDLGLGGLAPRLVAPRFAAYIPAPGEPADAYYRVVSTAHWPWWWPGGGLSLER